MSEHNDNSEFDKDLDMPRRTGFTLIELVVVIMIIAILGAVAAPRLMGTRKSAQDSATIQTLSAIRNAIAMYSADNGGDLPGSGGAKDSTAFKNDVEGYLRQAFPSCYIGAASGKEADVLMSTSDPFTGTTTADEGWAFNTNTGEFIVNSDSATSVDPSKTYDDL